MQRKITAGTKKWFWGTMIILVNIAMFSVLSYLVIHERNAYLSLRKEAGKTLMTAVSHNLEYSLKSEERLKEQLKNNLLNVASYLISESQKNGKLNISKLVQLSNKFKIFKIAVLDKDCKAIYVSRGRFGKRLNNNEEIKKVCSGEIDYWVIGLKQNYRKTGYRFVLVKRVKNGGAVVLMADATYLKNVFKEISFFHVLDSIVKYKDIEFVRFERLENVVYERYSNPEYKNIVFFPPDVKKADGVSTRVVEVGDTEILELSKNIVFNGVWYGVLRLGLSLKYIDLLDKGFLVLALGLFFLVILLDGVYVYAIRQTGKLYEESSKFHSVINQIEDGILIKQNEGNVLNNKAALKHLGKYKNNVLSMKEGTKTFEIEGKKILVSKKVYPFGEVFIIRDVTIEEISKESKEREKKIFSMGKLASSFAHEVRNPLNTISMIIQQIAFSPNLSDSQKEMIEIVKKEISRLNEIVKEFMEVSKTPELDIERIEISSFLTEICKFYKNALKKDSKKIKLEIDDGFTVELDYLKFKGVVINLIQNAFEADADEVLIKVKKVENFGVISIIDNGKGMSEEEKERAFDLYFTTKSEGSGLGLPYVQRIVALHGGFVKLESKEGKGSKFEIFLPLKTGER